MKSWRSFIRADAQKMRIWNSSCFSQSVSNAMIYHFQSKKNDAFSFLLHRYTIPENSQLPYGLSLRFSSYPYPPPSVFWYEWQKAIPQGHSHMSRLQESLRGTNYRQVLYQEGHGRGLCRITRSTPASNAQTTSGSTVPTIAMCLARAVFKSGMEGPSADLSRCRRALCYLWLP